MNAKRVEAGKYETFVCPFCHAKCNVVRDKQRPQITGFASAMSWQGVPEIYDEFKCPNSGEKWHEQVEHLREEEHKTASPTLRGMINADIQRLLYEKHETVSSWSRY